MKPSTPRGLPAPRSNAAARSRNTRQYTQRLSIQNEGGFRFTGRCRRVRESSFLWTCHWGGCSKMVLTFRGYVISQSLCLPGSHPFSNEGNRRANRQSCLPRSFSVGKSMDKPEAQCCQCSTWPQVPINAPDYWPAQRRGLCSGHRMRPLGLVGAWLFWRVQLDFRVVCGQG